MIRDAYSRLGEKSLYIPPKEVSELTKIVQKDYALGHEILTRSWIELNDRSVIDDENRGQLMFNAFVDTSVDDPAEAWKWRGTRSQARNKGITMHAQLTANFLYPLFTAQNDNDEVDQDFSEIMRDVIEWMCLPDNSNYQSSFMAVVFGMIKNPIVYMGAEFFEVYQTIKDRLEDGSVSKKEILDSVLSGFSAPIYSANQVLITNAYERNIQKQRAITKRRWVEKDELEALYGDHPNWKYVKTGFKSLYNDKDGLFYDIKDDQHPLLVEECIWMNRRQDSEVPFVGGIYLGDADIDANPIKHRDNAGAPKYNVIPFGYHRIGEHFFYYKSMMNVVGWDNMLYDAMTELVMNRSILETDPPYAISGSDKIDSEVIFPKAIVAFEDPATKMVPLLPPANLSAGFAALQATEKSMSDESIDPTSSGQVPDGHQQAYVIAQVTANAKKIISGVAKSLSESIAAYGDLMKDIAINHITTPQVEELVGGSMRLKYRSFLLENKQVGGKTMHKQITFDESLIGSEMTDQQKSAEALELLEKSGWPDSKQALIRVNPEMFAKFKYLSRADVEEVLTKNNEYWQPVLTQLYTVLRQDPLIDPEFLLRRLSRAYFNSEGDGLVKKQPAQMPGAPTVSSPEVKPTRMLSPSLPPVA